MPEIPLIIAVESTQSSRLTPAPARERIELIDAVRGFAIYGVLLANLIWVSQQIAVVPAQLEALPTAALDRFVRYGVEFFIDWKFYTLFSFLFGLGFSVQLMRANGGDAAVLRIHRRRLSILFVFGLIHAHLVWFGDILHHYALLGFLLILTRKWSNRVLLGMGLGLGVLLPAVVTMTKALLDTGPPQAGLDGAALQIVEARFRAFTSGSYSAMVRENAALVVSYWTTGFALHFVPAILGKFLLGYYAGRRGLLQNPREHLALFRHLCIWGLVAGLIGNGIWVWTNALLAAGHLPPSSIWVIAAQLPIYIGVMAMAAFYLSGLVLLSQRPRWRSPLIYLAFVGRMALTNYLTHSIIFIAVFYGFGLKLMGRVGATFCLILSIVIFAGQTAISSWWLRSFRFGPAEWLWRSLTYRTRPPMRIRTTDQVGNTP